MDIFLQRIYLKLNFIFLMSTTCVTLALMNCPICFEDTDDVYTIACGSKVPHQICTTCKKSISACPFCRIVEHSVDAQFRQYLRTHFPVAENFHYKIRALGSVFNSLTRSGTFHVRVRRVLEPTEESFHDELMPNKVDYCIVLLEAQKNYGHWTVLVRQGICYIA